MTNLTYGNSEGRVSLQVGIAYDADVGKAKDTLLAIARRHPKVMATPEPAVLMNGFGENAVDLTLLCFVEDVNERGTVRSDLYFEALRVFEIEGIDIPCPRRDVRIRHA